MRMPRFRFTVRGMMVAVAVVACAIWGERMRRTSIDYRGRADLYHAATLWLIRDKEDFPFQDDEIRHYETLASKYRRAARYPWLPVAPDPPEPE